MTLTDKVRQNIAARQLAKPGDSLLVAVSGGVDSMVLLRLLKEIASENSWKLAVAHFDHQLRGEESSEDQRFVASAAQEIALPFFTEAADVRLHARNSGVSIEMAARKLRHRFLARTAVTAGARSIALAHHADDQVETFWLRLLRGNVGEGLGGMRWRSPSPADPAIFLIRPLLNASKVEISDYATAIGIAFREDSSNSELHYQRNRLRHEILPTLASYQPQIRELTLRLSAALADDKDFIRAEAHTANYGDAHPAVQREILLRQLIGAGVEPSFEKIERLRTSSQPVMLAPGIIGQCCGDGLKVETVQRTAFNLAECTIALDQPGSRHWNGVSFAWEIGSAVPGREGLEQFDADVIGPEITLRHWRPGDRFRPIGMSTEVKVQDLFGNLKIPERERHERLLATNANGVIFWIEGTRIGEIAKITLATTRVLHWSWRR